MAAAAKARPADEACLAALLDILTERGDPRERWLRRHVRLRQKLAEYRKRVRSRNDERKAARRGRRLDYALQVNF